MAYKLPTDLSRTIFRSNDIRGNVRKELTPDVVYAIGLAFGSEAFRDEQQKIILARDGRLSSQILFYALAQGLMASGMNVIDIGAVPTPLLYFATHVLETTSGIMITGSHNPPDDNGLKMVYLRQILSEQQILSLYNRIRKKHFLQGHGKLHSIDIVSMYISRVLNNFRIKRKLSVVVDCGNGIVGKVFPGLARQLGCDVIPLYCDVDGAFPNHFPDPSVPSNLQTLIQIVKENQADLGVAFDGDGDRLGVVTNHGKIIWPDRQLMLFAEQVLQRFPKIKNLL